MSIPELLSQRRSDVLARWRELVASADPRPSLRPRGEDPFHDPVGMALRRATEAVYDEVAGGRGGTAGGEPLEALIKIRAVQGMSAARAVGFLLDLRRVLVEVCGTQLEAEPAAARAELDARIDAVALAAFDVYVGCRQRLSDVRVRETASRYHLLLERAGLLATEAGASQAQAAAPAGGTSP